MLKKSSRHFFKMGLAGCCCLAVFLALCSALRASAQTAQASPAPLLKLDDIKDFRPLFDERERLIEDIKTLQQTIEDLKAKSRDLPPRAQLERELNRLNNDLDKEQKKQPNNDDRIRIIQGYIDATTDKLETAKNATELQSKKDQLDQDQRRLTQVEQKIASLFDDKRDVTEFRAISTTVIGVLIAIVVGGFYLIAWKKDGIAAKIFGGEMGMQFVTLFLIVIAIILFGIMGTLEGRELAALLGGLSGYILGKASLKNETPTNRNGTPDQGQPNQNQQNAVASP